MAPSPSLQAAVVATQLQHHLLDQHYQLQHLPWPKQPLESTSIAPPVPSTPPAGVGDGLTGPPPAVGFPTAGGGLVSPSRTPAGGVEGSGGAMEVESPEASLAQGVDRNDRGFLRR